MHMSSQVVRLDGLIETHDRCFNLWRKTNRNFVNEYGLHKARDIVISMDGRHAYIVAYMGNSISWFNRDLNTGVLTYQGMLKDGIDGVNGLYSVYSLKFGQPISYLHCWWD